MQLCFVITLYALGALLPLIGIGHAMTRVALPARQYRHRAPHIQKLREKLGRKWEAATTEEEKQLVEEWRVREYAKEDPWGVPYGRSDDGFSTRNAGAEAWKDLQKLALDAALIGGGILAGTAASIWSLWL